MQPAVVHQYGNRKLLTSLENDLLCFPPFKLSTERIFF